VRTALIAVAGMALLLGGCGRHAKEVASDTAIPGAPDCGKKPVFVGLYADAKVTVCSAIRGSEDGKDSGTIIYTSAAAPAAILAWSKAQAVKAGLIEQLSTPETISVAEGETRTVMVMAAPNGKGSQVTVSWSRLR
jgi:hypothetical protein